MSKRSLYIWVFVFFACIYSFFSIGHYGGDGYEDYLTAESLVLDGNTALYDRPDDPDELEYKTGAGIKGKDGRIYSSGRKLGVPILIAPLYGAGHLVSYVFKQAPHDHITMMFASFYNPLVTAAGVLLVLMISIHLGFKRRLLVVVAFLYGLTTMTMVYTRTGFADPTLVVFLLLTAYFLITYSKNPRMVYLAWASLSMVYCVLTKVNGLIFLPCFIVYLMWVSWEKGQTVSERLKPVLFFVILTSLLTACALKLESMTFGGISSLDRARAAGGAIRILEADHFLKGVYYYLFSPGKGFLIYNITLIPAFFAVKKIFKLRNKEAILFFLIFIVNLVFYAKSFRRGSLFSWGPRYLLPSVPFMSFLVGYFLEDAKSVFKKTVMWLLSLTGFAIMLPCMMVNQSKFYFFVVEKLKLDEYLINFIPDLSPIKGAWSMLISRLAYDLGGAELPFVFDPDYRLVGDPVTYLMEGYNYLDLWSLKVIQLAPAFGPYVNAVLGILILSAFVALYKIYRNRDAVFACEAPKEDRYVKRIRP